MEIWEELALAHFLYFVETDDPESLDQSIDTYERALRELPDRVRNLHGVGKAYAARWQLDGRDEDIRLAMLNHQRALSQYDLSQPSDRIADIMADLAALWMNYFENTRNTVLLSRAIKLLKYILDYETHAGEDVVETKLRLSEAYFLRYDEEGGDGNLQSIKTLVKEIGRAADDHDYLRALLLLAETLSIDGDDWGALRKYQEALQVQEDVIFSKRSLRNLMDQLCDGDPFMRARSFPSDAAAAAITCGKPELALEMLERGRSLLLGQIERYRVDLGPLHRRRPQLARDFERLSYQLEQATVHNRRTRGETRTRSSRSNQSHDELMDRWKALKEEIQDIPQFADLFDPPTIKELCDAADEGPVITLNVSRRRCDALILLPNRRRTLVQMRMPNARQPDLRKLARGFKKVLESQSMEDAEQEDRIRSLLKELWDCLVEPIVKELQDNEIPLGARIWWNPTGPACSLPLHAACTYGLHERPLKRHSYISSYTPNLRTLVRARSTSFQCSASNPRLLLVTQPRARDQDFLKGVVKEYQRLSRLVDEKDRQPRSLHDWDATYENVTKAMEVHPWVHFACHGSVDVTDPLRTHFCLGDDELRLLDLLNPEFSDTAPDFAFLSVCDSAASDSRAPDESLHLAAGMLLAGCRSVVATMFPARDEEGAELAEHFYLNMGFKSPRRSTKYDSDDDLADSFSRMNFGAKEPARELHNAMKDVSRSLDDGRYTRLCTYVHYGI